jgi:CCR4-NOT transcription complex subunit 9
MASTGDIEQYVHQLSNPATRENALLELSKKRENFPELAPYLWYSFGTVAALLQEIVSIYPLLSPPSLTAHASNRVCNALALLQCVASHPETRGLFLQGAWLRGCWLWCGHVHDSGTPWCSFRARQPAL